MAAPDDIRSDIKGPRNIRNERVDRTDAPDRHRASGGHRGEQKAIGSVEVDSDCRKIVKGAECDRTGRGSDRSDSDGDTNMPAQDIWLGGPGGDQEAMGCIERNWKRENVVGGDGYNGSEGWKDDVTSGAHYDSKQVRTQLLAGQDRQHRCDTQNVKMDIPRSSQPPSNHTQRPHTDLNPPHRRGRIKRDLQVSATPGGLTRSHGRTEAESGELNAPDTLYMDHRWSRSDLRA